MPPKVRQGLGQVRDMARARATFQVLDRGMEWVRV